MGRLSRRWRIGVAILIVIMVLAGGLLVSRLGLRQAARTVQGAPAQALDMARDTVRFYLRPAPTVASTTDQAPTPLTARSNSATNGPLRVSSVNPRYFSDADGKIIYLTGSHTWSNLQDNGGSDPPPAFDYEAYLDFLQANNHNFFRLWTWEQSRWTVETSDDNYWFAPMPYQRTGPGNALDGKPKFDLSKLNQAYFDRLRARVIAARERGIYVSVMLFDGWSVSRRKGGLDLRNPWLGHPFHKDNNINNINGDPNNDNSGEESHELRVSEVTALQEIYIRKVVDTVDDLDNVLYEVSNESDPYSEQWQYHVIDVIKAYQATKPAQHPIGMTLEYPGGNNPELYDSAAEWISIGGDLNDLPSADGRKVLLTDTDHLCGICGDRTWVWKSFTRGHNPIFMDGYDGAGYGVGGEGFDFDDPTWVSLRKNLGYTLTYANRMDLAKMTPRGDLASTGYALANPAAQGAEYLVYAPEGGQIIVDLSDVTGTLLGEWFNPSDGTVITGLSTTGGGNRAFTPPFSGDAVLYIYHEKPAATATPTGTATRTPTPTATRTAGPAPWRLFLPILPYGLG